MVSVTVKWTKCMCCGERKKSAIKVVVRNLKVRHQSAKTQDKYFWEEKQNKRFKGKTTLATKTILGFTPLLYRGEKITFVLFSN